MRATGYLSSFQQAGTLKNEAIGQPHPRPAWRYRILPFVSDAAQVVAPGDMVISARSAGYDGGGTCEVDVKDGEYAAVVKILLKLTL